MFLPLLRLLRGSILFEVRGGYPERMINLCVKNGIPLWDGKRLEGAFQARTTAAGAKRLPELARKSGLLLTIRQRQGLPRWLERSKKRIGLLAGAAVAGAALILSSSIIWNIQVTGNHRLSTEEILSVLQELGVHRGTFREGVDVRNVERQMMLHLDDLSWVAVNLKGSTASIRVRERVLPPEILDVTTPSNIVSTSTGYITAMDVFEGQAVVDVGDAVTQGELLVSGIMEDGNGKNRTVRSRAKITARVEDTLAVTIPLTQTDFLCRGVETRHSLILWGHAFSLSGSQPPEGLWKREAAVEPVPFVGSFLPVYILRENYILLEERQTTYSPLEAMELALEELSRQEEEKLASQEIIRREVTGQELEDRFLLFADYLVEREIGEEKEILLKNVE